MATNNQLVSSPQAPVGQIIDQQTGYFTQTALKWAQGLTQAVNASINVLGQFVGNIAATAKIGSRTEGIGTTVNHIDATGVMQSTGLVAATSASQGAVVMYPGAVSNVLGTASGSANTAFDAAGSAAAAQAAAIAASNSYTNNASNINSGTLPNAVLPTPGAGALGGVKSATAGAHNFATGIDTSGNPVFSQPAFSDLSGSASAGQIPALSSLTGAITAGQLPAAGISVTITTAKLTGGGANGSMTFVNGQLTAQVAAT